MRYRQDNTTRLENLWYRAIRSLGCVRSPAGLAASQEEIEDALCEAFLRYFSVEGEDAGKVRDPGAWAVAAARNYLTDERRHEQALPCVSLNDDLLMC